MLDGFWIEPYSSWIFDVLRYPPHSGFRGENIPGAVDGNSLSHGSLGRVRFVGRHKGHYLAILQAPNANSLEPGWMPLWLRFGVCRINRIVPVYGQAAYPAEFPQ